MTATMMTRSANARSRDKGGLRFGVSGGVELAFDGIRCLSYGGERLVRPVAWFVAGYS